MFSVLLSVDLGLAGEFFVIFLGFSRLIDSLGALSE